MRTAATFTLHDVNYYFPPHARTFYTYSKYLSECENSAFVPIFASSLSSSSLVSPSLLVHFVVSRGRGLNCPFHFWHRSSFSRPALFLRLLVHRNTHIHTHELNDGVLTSHAGGPRLQHPALTLNRGLLLDTLPISVADLGRALDQQFVVGHPFILRLIKKARSGPNRVPQLDRRGQHNALVVPRRRASGFQVLSDLKLD